ncbi:MAG: enoyl-CoA hydratase-related protein [Acidimicrobiales bacterium]
MDFETIRYELDGGVATVTLDRPERLNAWNARMGIELGLAMAAADDDDAVGAVVVTGNGRAFCAGADLSGGEFGGGDATGSPAGRQAFPFQIRKPVIAAINGHAIGVGITYPLLADVRFIATEAKVQFAFVRRGVIPELASHVILPRVIGLSRAAGLLLTGRMITGADAAALGLAEPALPAAEVLPAAQAMAHEIASSTNPVSVAVAKRLLWEGMLSSPEQMLEREGPLFAWMAGQPAATEGITHFLERRPAAFRSSVSSGLPPML